ncbi:MAG TPA: oxygen-dependent coproporphyrinogen oxidase, partial [Myxococcales bacterium]|nr:oxygen-dependent coproporphyrinogen oxidase [Myxococcales bacterium]
MSGELRGRVTDWLRSLQDSITDALSAIDGGAFREDSWDRPGGGGGRTRVLERGAVLERGGVNFSEVFGELPNELGGMPGSGRSFYATGLSLVLHPRNPFAPTVHANFRYLERGDAAWFGGGADLTPSYLFDEDARHFHATLKAACDRHDPALYPAFKRECDAYFLIAHRGERRGVGGIFFDYLQGDPEKRFAFVRDAGEAFLPAYLPILEKRKDTPYVPRHRDWQLLRRGRYVEFNLVYDRGTVFGLKTAGRIESILMSLPPHAAWAYA